MEALSGRMIPLDVLQAVVRQQRDRSLEAIQVCYELNDETREREVAGLMEALEHCNLDRGAIVTRDQDDTWVIDGKTIVVVPAWRWALRQSSGKR